MTGATELDVECYAGHRGEETPRAFRLGGRRIEVLEVIDCWLAPEHRYFKCRGSDDGVYILRHDPARSCWELTMFASAPGARDWGVSDRTRH